MNIDLFLDSARKEYQEGAHDRRVPIGDFIPKAHETEDYLSFYLEESSGQIFGESGQPAEEKSPPPALNLSKWSLGQYCRRVKPDGAPLTSDYIRDCTPKLAISNLNTWVRANAENEVFLRIKTDKNGQKHVRAVLAGTWSPLDALVVGTKLKPFLGSEPIEYTLTDRFWRIVRWAKSIPPYEIGFRIMGSEVGAMPHLRVDTVLGFPIEGGYSVVPVLKDGKPLGKIAYSSSGAKALSGLTEAINKGLSQSSELTDCLEQRRQETLKYPQDEFIDIVDYRNLPTSAKTAVTERAVLFEDAANKLDLVRILSKLASEASGHAQIRIEEAAALYALTGKARDRINRNEESWEEV